MQINYFIKESDIMLTLLFIIIALILIPTVVIPYAKEYLRYMDEISYEKEYGQPFYAPYVLISL